MKRRFGIMLVLATSLGIAISQQYQPGPYAPRQPYPPRTLPQNRNPGFTNYYLQNQPRPGLPMVPTNRFAPAPVRTNSYPPPRFVPTNRFAPNPLSFSNALPRAGYATNASRFAPSTNLPGYTTSPANPLRMVLPNTGTNVALAPGGSTNSLLPNPTNDQSRLALTPAQVQDINRLTTALHAIKTTPASAAQRQQILGTLRASIRATARPAGEVPSVLRARPGPSEEALRKLVDDLVAAWPNNRFSYQQKFQLAVDLNRVVNCGNLSPGQVLVVINDARRVLQAGGVAAESTEALIDDLAAIAGELQKTPAKESAALPEAEK